MTCRQHRNHSDEYRRQVDLINKTSPYKPHNPEAPTDGLDDHWHEPETFWQWYWRTMRPSVRLFAILLAIVLVIAAWLLLLVPVRAHMHDRPDLDQWLRTLYSKARGPCCDSSEAETMADPDWRNASEMKQGECVQSSSVATPNDPVLFCVRLENPDHAGDWKWWSVPEAATVELPNRAGPALIWLIWNNRGTPDYQPYIRCFLPGTLS